VSWRTFRRPFQGRILQAGVVQGLLHSRLAEICCRIANKIPMLCVSQKRARHLRIAKVDLEDQSANGG
jgi:hypothetical protein